VDEFTLEEFGVNEEDLNRFKLELYQIHLPKLVDAEYIEWNRDRETINRGPEFETIEPTLEMLLDNEDDLPDDWA
jgi:hypothetical protein